MLDPLVTADPRYLADDNPNLGLKRRTVGRSDHKKKARKTIKLLGTSASLLVTSALLVVTRSFKK